MRIDNLIFDLDYTLYPSDTKIETKIKDKIFDYLQKEKGYTAEEVKAMLARFVTGEKLLKDDAESEDFLEYVCDVDVSEIKFNPELKHRLSQFSQNLYIYTNSTVKHVKDVLEKLEISEFFEGVFTPSQAKYCFKPGKESYDAFFKKYQIEPKRSVFFEDNLVNLERGKEYGMITVLISPEKNEKPSFCDYVCTDINQALKIFE